MDQDRIEADADSNSCAESETLSISDASSQEENSRSIGGREPKNKMKLRSIKLSRLPSFGSCIRPQKSPSTQSPCLVSGCAASSQQSTPIAMPDGPPNYTKATNCSDAKNGSLQKSAGMLTRRSSFKSKKSLTRASSKRKLKKTRSTKVASFGSSGSNTIEESAQHDQPSVVLKADFQASPPNSECSDGIGSNDQDRIDAEAANSTSHSSVRVLKKTPSLRPQRILTKTASLKSKRSARKKCTQVSEIPDSNVERATCSSTLKDNKFPRQVEVKTRGGESGGNPAMRVCPYTYCSLHGHRHGNVPPLKRFVSMRRRLLKNQRNMKPESRSIPKAKRSTNRRKGTQTSQIVCKGDSADKETVQDKMANSSSIEKVFKPDLNSASSHSGEDKHIGDCANLAQTLLNETTLHPNPSIEQHKTSDSLNTKPQHKVAFSAVQEASEECCCIPTEPIKLVLEISNTDNKEEHNSASSAHSGDDEPILSVDHHKFTETSTTTWVIGKEKKENFEPDNDFLKGNSPSGDCTTDEPHTQTEKRKYTGFWGMIYQHMKSGIAAEVETELPLDGKDKEEQLKDENALLQKNESVCFQTQSLSGKDQKIGMGEYEECDKKFEPWQSDTIKLVREAFDNFLSEIPDNSSGDQSISSDITSEQDLLEKNHNEGGERNILSSFECTKESIKLDAEESETEAVDINNKASEEEKAASKQENKSSQQISKNWSNLKKVIMLKRFVKALEKVRNFNPQKPRFLPVEPDSETEKVNLRHQTLEERKNADEWMLDYALRQVISDLAPAQKRKVALLVQAFETVTLPTDIKTRLSFNAEFSSHAAPVQACTGSPIHSSGQNNSGSLGKAPYLEMSFKETPDEVSNISTSEWHIPGTCSELTERDLSGCSNAEVDMSASETAQTNLEDEETVAFNLERKDHNSILTDDQPALVDISPRKLEEPRLSNKSSSKPDDTGSTSPEEFPVSGKVHSEVSKEVILIHDSEVCDCNIKFDSKKLETGNLIDADSEQSCELKIELSIVSSVVYSDSFPELSEELVAACDGKANSQREVLQEFSPQAKSEPHDTIDMDNLIDAGGEQSGEPKSELSSIVSSVVSSASFSKLSDEPMAACGGQANPEHEVLQQSSPQEESEPRYTIIDAGGEQSGEPKSELSSIVSSVVSSASFSKLSDEPMAACGGQANPEHEVLQQSSPQEESEPRYTIIDAGGEQSGEPKSELSSIVSSVVSSASFSKLSDEPMAACGGQANPEHEVLQQSSPQEESEPRDTNDTQPEYKLEKQKYMRLWYLVYKHMVSSSVEDGDQPLEGKDKEDQGGDANKLLGTEDADSCKDWSEMNQKMLMDNQIESSQIIECHNIEAIKLIEEAIDDINLPEIEGDSTDDQSITGNKISEPNFQKKHGESRDSEDSFGESNKTKIEQGTALDPKETRLDSDNINALEESETESKLVNKCKPQTLKSWSNLKRLILVKRFTKALEKVRKFNPRKPQYLCLDSDSETEKVNLRHQNMEDRKNAEEWMLDHALQQVVAKLTPARKRKVELLIEAFETVTPSLEVKTLQHHSTADSPHARLIHV